MHDLLKLPSLILFIRGSWCPLCFAQVKEVAGAYRELDARGIRIIVITPQSQQSSADLAKMHKVPITYLVDRELTLAKKLDLIHKDGVPILLPRSKFGKDTVFPTAIITNEQGELIYVNQTDDITIRPEPATFLKVFDAYQVNSELEHKVQIRTAEVRDLLDNIGEGFFSFGSDFSVHKEKSKACDIFFGTDIKYKDPFLLFKVSDTSGFHKICDLVFSGNCPFEIICDLLPKDVELKGNIFDLQYHWVADTVEVQNSKIIVIMKDVTTERRLASQFADEEAINTMIVKVAIDREGFIHVISDVRTILSRLNTILAQPVLEVDPNELFNHFHTIKGGLSIFGLSKVTQFAHRLEGILSVFRTENRALTEDVRLTLISQLTELARILDGQLKDLSAIITQDDLDHENRYFKITASQITALSNDLLSRIPKESRKEVQSRIDELRKQPLKGALKRLVSLAEDLGPQLDKKLKVRVQGYEIPVFYEKLEAVFGSLVHLVRNSVDHGLETSEAREAAGKPSVGTLTFTAVQEGRDLKLSIADDGGGIDVQAVKQVALKRNLMSQAQLDQLSSSQVAELIFSPGFSTKTEVTDISGRGVGMSAVKTAIEEAHGKISVKTTTGKGTQFDIYLPEVA